LRYVLAVSFFLLFFRLLFIYFSFPAFVQNFKPFSHLVFGYTSPPRHYMEATAPAKPRFERRRLLLSSQRALSSSSTVTMASSPLLPLSKVLPTPAATNRELGETGPGSVRVIAVAAVETHKWRMVLVVETQQRQCVRVGRPEAWIFAQSVILSSLACCFFLSCEESISFVV
jgi:hypothetical protein